MEGSYRTLLQRAHASYKAKGSRHLAYAAPVAHEAAAVAFIKELREVHPKASHVAYAYILDDTAHPARKSDDGEPAHTAGDPILNQLRTRELLYAAVAVVRYFGGTKLGKRGLIAAYGAAASAALDLAGEQLVEQRRQYRLSFAPAMWGAVETMIKRQGWRAFAYSFTHKQSLTISIPLAAEDPEQTLAGVSGMECQYLGIHGTHSKI